MEKVYCENCKHYGRDLECYHPDNVHYKDEYKMIGEKHYLRSEVKNANNDCKDYEEVKK